MNTLFFAKRNAIMLFVVSAGLSVLTGFAANQRPFPTISTHLTVAMNDEACKLLIERIRQVHGTLETLLAQELGNSAKLNQVKNRVTATCFKICSINELLKINAAKDAFVKILLALCDASTGFLEEVLQPEVIQAQQNGTLAQLVQKTREASQKIKRTLSSALSAGFNNQPANDNNTVDRYYNMIICDIKDVIIACPHVTINNKNIVLNKDIFTVDTLRNYTSPYADRFDYHVKKALSKHLTKQDLESLIAFFDSTAYPKIKNNINAFIADIFSVLASHVITQTETVLNQFWTELQPIVNTAAERLGNYLVR